MLSLYRLLSFLCARRKSHILLTRNLLCSKVSSRNNDEAIEVPNYLSGSDPKVLEAVKKDFKVYENFISELEEENLLKEIDSVFKRRRYQFDHWDNAIHGFKETEKANWNEENSKVIQRLKDIAFPTTSTPMRLVHVLDLAKTGHIKPHIDSIRFCGDIISGISLLSSSVMRLVKEEDKNIFVDVLLPRRSLYVMRGDVRYKYNHEILKDAESFFKRIPIPRDRRISIMCRNEPEEIDKT